MGDKRHYKRFTIEGEDILSKTHFTTEADLLDISLGGASINLDRRLTVGERYQCRIKDGKQTASVSGTVVWEEKNSAQDSENSEPGYSAGLCFKKVFTHKGTNLAGLMEEWARTKLQRKRVRGLRIKLKDTKAELDHYGEYTVDEISFGGMRIETGIKVDKGAELKIKMSIPDTMKPVRVKARIASCRMLEGAEPPRYKVGVEFIDMPLSGLNRIKELIYSLD